MSWQQALQDKGCKSQSQGTKEEKLWKRQAPAPRRAREAQEAGGTMNVENTGKAGLPADPALPSEASTGGRLLCGWCYPYALSSLAGGGLDRLQLPDPQLQAPSLPLPDSGTVVCMEPSS